jgi:transcriptional regulator with XRE-family HTH domain
MPRRTVPVDPSIGERIQARRQLRRWSIRHAAQRAGISHTTWMRIERGELRTDRYMIADLAAALECSVTDLTGQPYAPADRSLEAAHSRVDLVWRALMAHALSEPPSCPCPPLTPLAAEAALVRDLYNRCDYAAVLDRLVPLIPDLHAAAHEPDPRVALALMVPVYGVAMGSLLNLGYPAHAWLAVERCREAAQQLEDPIGVAVAAANSGRVSAASGAYGLARTMVTRAADDLEFHLSAATALETLGFLHLARAHYCSGLKDARAAADHLNEASRSLSAPVRRRAGTCSSVRATSRCGRWPSISTLGTPTAPSTPAGGSDSATWFRRGRSRSTSTWPAASATSATVRTLPACSPQPNVSRRSSPGPPPRPEPLREGFSKPPALRRADRSYAGCANAWASPSRA